MCESLNISAEIAERKINGLYRTRRRIDSPQGAIVKINEQEYINFSSNDYLGLANNALLKECMIEAVKQYGIGAASSQLVTGYSKAHEDLESKLAKFLKRESTLVFPTGYQANLAIASAMIDSDTIVLQDKLNHASLIDAGLLSKGKLVRYKHNDVHHLSILLDKYNSQKCVVMTDGVFSMDGDYARLDEIADLCKSKNALLVVDDAHGVGVLGDSGAGLLEKFSVSQDQVPLLIGTFGKAFGMNGAFISGSSLLIDAFIQKARTYIYTTALSPAVAVTVSQAIDIISGGSQLRENIKCLILHFKKSLSAIGFEAGESESHIQPVILGGVEETLNLSEALFKNNVLATAIRPPTVPPNTSRLRISLTANHCIDQVDRLINIIKQNLH